MRTHFNPKNNPRVIIIQKLYGKFYNEDDNLDFPKHRFKKFIKDIVTGTIERNDLILDELNTKLGDDFVFENLDKVFQTILKAATYEFMYKPQLSLNIIIKEYLNSSNFSNTNSSPNLLFNSSKIRSFLSIVPNTISLMNFLNLCLGKSKLSSSL